MWYGGGGVGVLDDGGECTIGHSETALTTSREAVCENAEGIGITLEMHEILPYIGGQHGLQLVTCSFREECLYGSFTGMTEGRITQIVSEAGGGNDSAEFLAERACQCWITAYDVA